MPTLPDDAPVLVSACLLGEPTRHDGRSKPSAAVCAAVAGRRLIPFCPELAGGLPVPRPAVELRGGDGAAVLAGTARCVDREGVDRSAAFVAGAEAAVATGARVAILKERSPSCGCRSTWIDGELRPGRGVAAAARAAAGVRVLSDEELRP